MSNKQNYILYLELLLTNPCNTDVDECIHGTHNCDDNTRADCINTNGSFICVCKSGYNGNGEFCQLIGKLATS